VAHRTVPVPYFPSPPPAYSQAYMASVARAFALYAQQQNSYPDPLSWVGAPASASATGTAGQVAYDASYFYVCVDTDTWCRVAISTW